MQIERLDHVALWVADPHALAAYLTRTLDVHVIEQTEAFTIVGSDARRGKLTLFAAEGPRDPAQLESIGMRVNDLDAALARAGDAISRLSEPGRAALRAPEGLHLTLVEAPTDCDYDLDHVALRVQDPAAVRRGLTRLGFSPAPRGRLAVGGAFLELVEGVPGLSARPLLNHLGLLVASADDHLAEAEELGLEVADVVDAPNTYAVFVWGPERLKLEYVEHKATFSLR